MSLFVSPLKSPFVVYSPRSGDCVLRTDKHDISLTRSKFKVRRESNGRFRNESMCLYGNQIAPRLDGRFTKDFGFKEK